LPNLTGCQFPKKNFIRQGALMKTLYAPLKHHRRLVELFSTFLLLAIMAVGVRGQSTNIEYPTPVRSGEISGIIAPRDLGDSRLTRYFYSFTGTPGDLIITAESRNLEGDVDVFTAGTLRPLAKISLYAGSSRSGGTNTIYLRTREALILRVEARTPNDNEGSFRVNFNGAFEPISRDIPDPEPVIPTLSDAGGAAKGRRVTATGARIEEPEPVATSTPQPGAETTTPAEPATAQPSGETPAGETTETAEAATPQPSRPRTPRTRRGRSSRNTRSRPTTTARTAPTPAEPTATTPTVDPASGPRLIIETKDGMRVERYMTSVRRVTVQGGQIVVVTTDGKIERQPMSNVLRMAIEP
jgi:hypothetical protein